MFNNTIIASIQTLSPLWSEKVVTFFVLDNRYISVMNMLINGLVTGIPIDNDMATGLVLTLLVIAIFYYINYYFNGLFSRFIIKSSWFYDKIKSKKKVYTIMRDYYSYIEGTDIDLFFYNNVHYLTNYEWVSNYSISSWLIGDENNKKINKKLPYLKDGSYDIVMSTKLHFSLVINTSRQKTEDKDGSSKYIRQLSLNFYKGDEFLFVSTMNSINEKYVENNPVKKLKTKANLFHYDFENTRDFTQYVFPIYYEQYNIHAFDGYYHPRLDFIIKWVDSLQKPIIFSQPRQVSMICHGTSGSGKSSLARRLGQYLHRNVLSLNLLKFKTKKDLEHILCGTFTSVTNIIIEIDEFDKTVKIIKHLSDMKKRKENTILEFIKTKHEFNEHQKVTSVPDTPTDKKNEKFSLLDIEWTLDDLLKLFCGSFIPDGRIIIVTANDIETIKEMCPYLLRSGRLTPIKFTYGDRDLFIRIVNDYTKIHIDKDELPVDYKFTQSGLIEFVTTQSEITKEIILANISLFSGICSPPADCISEGYIGSDSETS